MSAVHPTAQDLIDEAVRSLNTLKMALDAQPVPIYLGEKHKRLTFRERTLLQLFAQGFISKQVAGQLGISYRSVESSKTRLMAKMEANTIGHAIAIAFQNKILQ